MKNTVFLICCCLYMITGFSQRVALRYAANHSPSSYAGRMLEKALTAKGYTILTPGPEENRAPSLKADFTIQLTSDRRVAGSEAFAILPDGHDIRIIGGDDRGMIYGSLRLAEEIKNGTPLREIRETHEEPHLPFRAIKFDLPWDTYRHSYALDQHIGTCHDTLFWEAFLDMMVDNRFNTLTLWNLHPYPFMIRPANFPEAVSLDEHELRAYQALFHSLFRMAKERCIDTYLVPFNIFVSPEFARAHGVALDNLSHDFFVNGDTSAIIRRYTRECVSQVLREYPELTGFGLTLGEGMGGMTPPQREEWMKETIVAGMKDAGRPTKLIHRIPFSSGTGSLGVTSIATEQLTRRAMEEEGHLDFLGGPVWADLKYNWSHAHSTPKLVKVHGGKLYDTYFKPLPQTYKIIWTARNEDFFCLRWGAPDFIRAHLAANKQPYVGGYCIGSETYIPAKDYFTRPGRMVSWRYAFERQWLFYKLWGRLLYDPATPDQVFSNEFIRRYGRSGVPLLQAYTLASRTPLRLASDFDFTWDFTLYSEGFLALDNATKSVRYISVDRLIRQPPTDPDYVSVEEYVRMTLQGGSFAKNRITPLLLADMLEKDCRKALDLVKDISPSDDPALLYEVADVKTWSWLGLHLAHQLRGAVALQQYRQKGDTTDQRHAIDLLQAALSDWDQVIAITRPLYQDMPLTHLSEQGGVRSKENTRLKWHWAMTRDEVAADVETARQARPAPGN